VFYWHFYTMQWPHKLMLIKSLINTILLWCLEPNPVAIIHATDPWGAGGAPWGWSQAEVQRGFHSYVLAPCKLRGMVG